MINFNSFKMFIYKNVRLLTAHQHNLKEFSKVSLSKAIPKKSTINIPEPNCPPKKPNSKSTKNASIECYRKTRIGFIGLGRMGSLMALRLKSQQRNVYGYDQSADICKDMKNRGLQICENLSEIAEKCHIIFTLLPNLLTLRALFNGEKGLFSSKKENLIFADLSTIGPKGAIELHNIITENKCNFVDAPVSGGLKDACNGSVIFTSGGNKSDFKTIKPYLLDMGKCAFYCGNDIGDGQSTRLCVLIMHMSSMCSTAEVMNFGDRLGLDLNRLYEIINSSDGQNWVTEHKMPVPNLMKNVPANNNYIADFPLDMFLRITPVLQQTANLTDTPVPIASQICLLYQLLAAHTNTEQDVSIVYKLFKQSLLKTI